MLNNTKNSDRSSSQTNTDYLPYKHIQTIYLAIQYNSFEIEKIVYSVYLKVFA